MNTLIKNFESKKDPFAPFCAQYEFSLKNSKHSLMTEKLKTCPLSFIFNQMIALQKL